MRLKSTAVAAPAPNILSQITIEHGPPELLAPLFLRAENALQQMGIVLSFASLEELGTVNLANRATWLPLFPIYQPAMWPDGQGETFCLFGRDCAGRVVYTIAVRIYDWPNTTFFEEAQSLRLFYGDVARCQRPGESCVVSARMTRRVHGRVAVAGGVWVHPDWRGNKELIPLGGQIARCYAIAHGNIDYYTAMMTESVYKIGLAAKVRVANVDWSIDMRNSMYGDKLRLAFIWSSRSELHEDLARFLVDLDPQVDGRFGLHDPQQNALAGGAAARQDHA